jgi:PadR family transcriptional regulator
MVGLSHNGFISYRKMFCVSIRAPLYPALHRLEHQAWIEAEWGESENNRRAKYYSLTKAGGARLEAEERSWARLSTAVQGVLKAV